MVFPLRSNVNVTKPENGHYRFTSFLYTNNVHCSGIYRVDYISKKEIKVILGQQLAGIIKIR